jgi:Mrp family chromosome partitioning ATPase
MSDRERRSADDGSRADPIRQDVPGRPSADGTLSCDFQSETEDASLEHRRPWPHGTIVAPVVRVVNPTSRAEPRLEPVQGRPPSPATQLAGGSSHDRSSSSRTPSDPQGPPNQTADSADATRHGAKLLVDPLGAASVEMRWAPLTPEATVATSDGPSPTFGRYKARNTSDPPEERSATEEHTPAISVATAVVLTHREAPSAHVRTVPPNVPAAALGFRTGAATLIGVQPPRQTSPDGISASRPSRAFMDQVFGGASAQSEYGSPHGSLARGAPGNEAAQAGSEPSARNAIVATGIRALLPPDDSPRRTLEATARTVGVAKGEARDAFATSLPAGRRPVLARLVDAQTPPRRRPLAMIDAPDSRRAESFRLLTHRLSAINTRIMAVAAPQGEEEAVLCAAELALTYAEASPEAVLLLEVDSQQPRLADVLGLTVEHCFALQLFDKHEGSPEPWRALSICHRHLHIMAISPSLCAGDRLAPRIFHDGLVDLARAPYNHILVVCPRILDSADIALIDGVVEGVVLTGAAGRTTATEMRRAARDLSPTRVLAVTLLES